MKEDYIKKGRAEEVITRLASKYILENANKSSLITVIKSEVSKDYGSGKITISVIPESEKKNALSFLKRKRGEFREYLRDNSKLPKTPFIDFIM